MNALGTRRTDDRQAVAAVDQTASCIILSLAAGSLHTAITAAAWSLCGGNHPSESIADEGNFQKGLQAGSIQGRHPHRAPTARPPSVIPLRPGRFAPRTPFHD